MRMLLRCRRTACISFWQAKETADTALRLAQYFGMSADFWMNLQSAYELDLARQQVGKAIQRIPKRSGIAEPRPAA
ncbi:MAG TPA: hypothetical protein VGQ49_21990 [Bryobacteraceae bacterium]|nr:hypothetical protein [Bryobacteraceae bacterium]